MITGKLKKRENNKTKRGQITIFVIIALILIVAIALIFVLIKNPSKGISADNPGSSKAVIMGCAKDATEEYLDKYMHIGGLNSSKLLDYNNTQALWLCYTPNNEEVCLNKHPALSFEIEKELAKYIKPRVEACFNNIKSQLQGNNYQEKPLELSASIVAKKIIIHISKEITYRSNENNYNLENFDTIINSNLFDFIQLATEISNQEVENCDCTQSCNADLLELNMENRDFEITKPYYSSKGEEVYTIKDILTGKKLNIAIRNCVR